MEHQDQGSSYKIVKHVGDTVLEREQRLLGQLGRREPDNVVRHVAFNHDLKSLFDLSKKMDHPRSQWADDNLERA